MSWSGSLVRWGAAPSAAFHAARRETVPGQIGDLRLDDGEGLRAGDVILSGGLTAAANVAAGDVVNVTIDRLGSVELGCV